MSLNGLDDPKVKEAHAAAIAEPGGWFLLKYVSRDELELSGRGNGGIVEIRNAIAQHEDDSPLYGFLRYRRRNVLIKYLPEDCSRLVQARVTVHFNSLCDQLSPYDTSFSIANSKELKDTKLSAACSLHAASGSTSSSTSSLRRRRLMEIAEEEEEGERERKRQSTVKEEERPTSSEGPENGTPAAVLSPASLPAVTLNSDLAASPEESQFAGTFEPPTFTGAPRPSSPAKSFDDAGRRNSSQSARPDLYSYGKKVKLGPRPSLETGGRPRTSAGTATYRPVSSIPAGFKLSSKGSKRSRSQDKIPENEESVIREEGTDSAEVAEIANSAASTIVSDSRQPGSENELTRPHTSSGGIPTVLGSEAPLKLNLPIMPPPPTKQNYITPEKARLMKAMKLREKKKLLSAQSISTEQSVDEPSEPKTPSLASDGQHEGEDMQNLVMPDELAVKTEGHADDRLYMSQADSAIGIDIANDQSSIDTRTDFHLDSPTGALSDIGDSTKASSLSDSTDETLQPDNLRKNSPIDDEADDDNDIEFTPVPIDGQDHGELDDEPVSQVIEQVSAEEQVQSTTDVLGPESTVQDEEATNALGAGPLESTVEIAPGEGPSDPNAALPVSKFASTPAPKTSERETASLESLAPRATPDSPQFKVPLSRFSTHENKPLPTTPTKTKSAISFIVTAAPHSENEATAHSKGPAKESDTEETGRASVESRRSKRRAIVEPIRTDLDPDKDRFQTESDFSDDDELMDELQSATLEQAKPMTVSKSPITPAFPIMSPKRSNTGLSATSMESSGHPNQNTMRALSNPIRGSLLSPADVSTTSARTVSSGAAFLHKITQQTSSADLRPKSAKIGSSISQRIKALERLSSTTAGSDAVPPKERPSSTFFSVRKTSPGGEPAKSPSVLARASAALKGTSPSPPESRESSPETGRNFRDRSGSMASRLSMFETGNAPRGRPESIQVTARIIRDPTQQFPKIPEPKADPSDYSPLNLKQSPLVVDHQRGSQSPRQDVHTPPEPAPVVVEPVAETQPERRLSLLQRRWSKGRRSQSEDRNGETTDDEPKEEPSGRPRRRSSLTVVKDFIKDRRDSLRGGRSSSTDNLSLLSPQNTGNLASPALATPSSRSGSRPPSVHQNSMFPRRLSINSRRSSIDAKSPALQAAAPLTGGLSPSLMTEATGEYDSDDRYGNGSGDKYFRPGSNGSGGAPSPGPKSANRATRFMRRLSNTIGSSRKNMAPSISPTVAEEDDAAVADQNEQHTPPSRGNSNQQSIATYLGDVNVQFPDTLLWKRRTMCLDSQGFLILSAVQGVPVARDNKLQAGAVKRYHLSDFRTPYIPEMEVQELPNSVVLDFVDGSGVQIACEDRAGQLNTLHILQAAHRNHNSFGQ
ncbi:hypothetical protein CONLIGDRAFT_569808 [Coniochaeta ligniaria NRRL 30616]|uniref:ADF-H domain-containing protein n=1 Tax=Coniochaeta ligniaria NRRL 30616 TaxID=1408157 RepID=A0A1J7JU44_9PEZI|nr:hypothetical protein CONLIGDRAFT_569808 [Coniochaeta ligniaria NRRL 30616]